MSIERTELLKNYVAAMHEGDAALLFERACRVQPDLLTGEDCYGTALRNWSYWICCRQNLGDGFSEVGRNLFRSSKATPVSTAE
jgi:hypothetical protein